MQCAGRFAAAFALEWHSSTCARAPPRLWCQVLDYDGENVEADDAQGGESQPQELEPQQLQEQQLHEPEQQQEQQPQQAQQEDAGVPADAVPAVNGEGQGAAGDDPSASDSKVAPPPKPVDPLSHPPHGTEVRAVTPALLLAS